MSKKGELTIVDPKDFGVQEVRANEIKIVFDKLTTELVELEDELNTITSKPMSKELCTEAKKLRLRYVKVRTGVEKVHKEQKAFYVAGGKFVDAMRNTHKFACSGNEDRLKLIENYYVNIELEKQQELRSERWGMLREIEGLTPTGDDLGIMSDDVWNKYHNGCIAEAEVRRLERVDKFEAFAKQTRSDKVILSNTKRAVTVTKKKLTAEQEKTKNALSILNGVYCGLIEHDKELEDVQCVIDLRSFIDSLI